MSSHSARKNAPTTRSILLPAMVLALLTAWPTGANAHWSGSRHSRMRREFIEGAREIRRERHEAFDEIIRSDSPQEFLREVREGTREVRRERQEMRREVRREFRRFRW